MKVRHLEVLVEERSMEAALRALLPGLLGELTFEIHAHRCKQDLLAKLPQRLRGNEGRGVSYPMDRVRRSWDRARRDVA